MVRTLEFKSSHRKLFCPTTETTGQRNVFPYKINNNYLPIVESSVRDLGIQMCKNLSKSEHIQSIRSKANSKSGLILRSFKTRNQGFLKKLFCTFVRPIVEYATPAWNPYLISDIINVESVQRSFTRRIPSISTLNYPDRLQILDIKSLEERRLKADLVELFKIISNKSGLKFEDFLAYNNNFGTRSEHFLQINIKFSKTNLGKHSFFNKSVFVWNSLPDIIVNSPSIATFREKLADFDLTQYLICFPDRYS